MFQLKIARLQPSQHTDQEVERACQFKVSKVGVPVIVRLQGLIETTTFLARLKAADAHYACRFDHAIDAGWTNGDDVRIQHHVAQATVAFAGMLAGVIDNGLLFPTKQPMFAGDR